MWGGLCTLTDNALHLDHRAAGRGGVCLLGEVAGVQHVVHRGPVLTVVQKLILLGVLCTTNNNKKMFLSRQLRRNIIELHYFK